MADPAARLETAWHHLSRIPGGRWLFGRLIARIVPYSGTVRPVVLALEPGRAVVTLRERRRLRNHLESVHAIALANLGELASGLAMTLALPDEARGIPVRIEIEYRKKARGTITAHGRADPPNAVPRKTDAPAIAELVDEDGDVVADMTVTWRLAPRTHRHLATTTAPSPGAPTSTRS